MNNVGFPGANISVPVENYSHVLRWLYLHQLYADLRKQRLAYQQTSQSFFKDHVRADQNGGNIARKAHIIQREPSYNPRQDKPKLIFHQVLLQDFKGKYPPVCKLAKIQL